MTVNKMKIVWMILISLLQPSVLSAAPRKYLFVNDRWIESTYRVHRTIHQPEREWERPVLVPEHPWEFNVVTVYGTVHRRENGALQMWYLSWARMGQQTRTFICYAESKDGFRWTKPDLGLVDFEGSKKNNIVIEFPKGALDGSTVIFDPDDPDPKRRYKMLFYAEGKDKYADIPNGLFAAFSPDGINFNFAERTVSPGTGDRTNLIFDRGAEFPYVAYTRDYDMMRQIHGRGIYRTQSKDFLNWSRPELILHPDLGDDADLQFYGMGAFPYEGIYLGWVQVLHTEKDFNDLQLVVSEDNKTWQRTMPRQNFLSVGQSGRWDQRWVGFSSNPPIVMHEKLWFYYEGRNYAHNMRYPLPYSAIGVATLRIDGFASIDARFMSGGLTTKAINYKGESLYLNLTNRTYSGYTNNPPSAWIKVEVQDETGKPIPGMTLAECPPLQVDSTRHQVNLPESALAAQRGKRIKLKFELVNSSLYSFWFE